MSVLPHLASASVNTLCLHESFLAASLVYFLLLFANVV